MKVLHLIPTWNTGTLAKQLSLLAPALAALGVESRIVVMSGQRTAGRTFAVVSCRPSLPELETLDRFQTLGTLEPIDHGLLSRHHSLLATRIGSMLGLAGWTRRKTLAVLHWVSHSGDLEKLEFRLLRRLDKIVFQWPLSRQSGRLIFL